MKALVKGGRRQDIPIMDSDRAYAILHHPMQWLHEPILMTMVD
jgi:hypothetical protein